MIFLTLGALAWWTGVSEWTVNYGGHDYNWVFSFALAFTMGHVFAVFFRTHLNKQFFQLYPYRFTVVPILFFLGLIYSQVFFVFAVVFIVFFRRSFRVLAMIVLVNAQRVRAREGLHTNMEGER